MIWLSSVDHNKCWYTIKRIRWDYLFIFFACLHLIRIVSPLSGFRSLFRVLIVFVNWCVVQWFSCATCGACCCSNRGTPLSLAKFVVSVHCCCCWFCYSATASFQLSRHKCICFYSHFWSVSSVLLFFVAVVTLFDFVWFHCFNIDLQVSFIVYVLIAVVSHRLLNSALLVSN